MARAAGVSLTLDDFQKFADSTPFIADLKPSGKMADARSSMILAEFQLL